MKKIYYRSKDEVARMENKLQSLAKNNLYFIYLQQDVRYNYKRKEICNQN